MQDALRHTLLIKWMLWQNVLSDFHKRNHFSRYIFNYFT